MKRILLMIIISSLLLLTISCAAAPINEHSGRVIALNHIQGKFGCTVWTEVVFEDGYILRLDDHWELKIGEIYYIETKRDKVINLLVLPKEKE